LKRLVGEEETEGKEIRKIDLGDDRKISNISGVVKFNENKK
jgi:hypothetical protein